MNQQQRHRAALYALSEALEEAHIEFAYQSLGGGDRSLHGDALSGLINAVEDTSGCVTNAGR